MTPVLSPFGGLLAGFGLLYVAATAFGCMILVGLLRPLLVRYALARPNARSWRALAISERASRKRASRR